MRLMNRCGIGPGKLFYPVLHLFNSVEKQNKCLCLSSDSKCMDFFLCMLFLKICILSDCFVFDICVMWVGIFSFSLLSGWSLHKCFKLHLLIQLNIWSKPNTVFDDCVFILYSCSNLQTESILLGLLFWDWKQVASDCATGYLLPDALRQWNGLIFKGWNV